MLKQLERRIKTLLKKRREEAESQEAVAQPLMDKIPKTCVNCGLCDWITHPGEPPHEQCSGKCQSN